MGAYVAPEVEVLSTVVEGGFSLSGEGLSFGFEDVETKEYGEL